jgi:Holliday junction DNA helicase RuvA
MISFLKGVSGGMESGGAMTVVVHDVGYRVIMNDRDQLTTNKKGPGSEVICFCRTTATENEITVYGFLDILDRHAFDCLLKVDGVGPVTALRLLSHHNFHALDHYVKMQKAVDLCVPGIGSKTAGKIVAQVKL